MSEAKDALYRRFYAYALKIIKFVEEIPDSQTTRVMKGQLIRSGTSVAANIIEAKGASSKKDYVNFYSYALKSANESKFWLCLLRDSGKVSSAVAGPLIAETTEISNILGASILTMKGKRKNY